jgi:hypothetical protein
MNIKIENNEKKHNLIPCSTWECIREHKVYGWSLMHIPAQSVGTRINPNGNKNEYKD